MSYTCHTNCMTLGKSLNPSQSQIPNISFEVWVRQTCYYLMESPGHRENLVIAGSFIMGSKKIYSTLYSAHVDSFMEKMGVKQ